MQLRKWSLYTGVHCTYMPQGTRWKKKKKQLIRSEQKLYWLSAPVPYSIRKQGTEKEKRAIEPRKKKKNKKAEKKITEIKLWISNEISAIQWKWDFQYRIFCYCRNVFNFFSFTLLSVSVSTICYVSIIAKQFVFFFSF